MRVLSFICISIFAISAAGQNTERLKIHTSDAEAFWVAYDVFKKDTTQNPFSSYLRNGSQAFREFQYYRIDSASFKNAVVKKTTYLEKIRSTTFPLDSISTEVIAEFSKFKKLYPQAMLPEVYFVIGMTGAQATTTNTAVVVGIEHFVDSAEQYAFTESLNKRELSSIILRAIVFYQQKPAHTGPTLLRQAIIHGSTAFVTSLFSEKERDRMLKSKTFKFGEQNEELLVKEFLNTKDSQDFSNWLYEPPTDSRPSDLGTWIGYKITEAYYNNATDKAKAISDIFKINDFDKFLELSGYTEIFKY